MVFAMETGKNTAVSRRQLLWIAFILGAAGAVLFVIAIIYFVAPASDLPSILGRIQHSNVHRSRRGTAAVILGALLWILAGAALFALRRKSRSLY